MNVGNRGMDKLNLMSLSTAEQTQTTQNNNNRKNSDRVHHVEVIC